MSGFNLDVDETSVAATVDPYVAQRFDQNDPAWRAIVNANAKEQRRRRWRHALTSWTQWRRRKQANIMIDYSIQWSARPPEEEIAEGGPVVPFVWGHRAFCARASANKRVRMLYLMRALEKLSPASILEVGTGNGVNLCLLAGRFAKLKVTGVEPTAGGVAAGHRLLAMPEIPTAIRAYSPEPIVDPAPFSRIRLVQGNAAALPFPDASFDLVLTFLALEQMEEIRSTALSEIRRVARNHVVMVEPFREWNADGPARDYIIANDYFAGKISDLPRYGLDPIATMADMPSKLAFRTGLVVSRVVARP